jgi:ATP adenylyltransferase
LKTTAVKKSGSKRPAARKEAKRSHKKNGPQWPEDRKILWRPDRLTYLQKKDQSAECVFCDQLSKGLKPETLVIFNNGTSMVILNKFPYNNGHLLVLPVRHVADLDALTEAEFSDIHKVVRQGIASLRKAYDKSPQGINVGANLGSAAGAGLPQHLHYHIIPRWIGDSNFFPLVGQTKVISETLEQTYARLLPYFEG